MNRICILIRVYNRVEDLKYCIDIIRDTWKSNNYFIIVVSNGKKDGYYIDNNTISKIDLLVEVDNNIGHFNGNSQLLHAGLEHIPNNCDYTVILEADTWMYSDHLIDKYIEKLVAQNAIWASAQFFRYVVNLATDFAIIKTEFIKSNTEIFTFSVTPEYYVANYLVDNNYKFIYIKENMPVNLPRYIKSFPFAPTGRFFSFPKGNMVTHHIETLAKGMLEKKQYFNIVANKSYFTVADKRSYRWIRFKMKLAFLLSFLLPYKGWIRKKQIRLEGN